MLWVLGREGLVRWFLDIYGKDGNLVAATSDDMTILAGT